MKTELRVIRLLLVVCVFLQLAFFVLAWGDLLPHDLFMQMSPREMRVEDVRALTLGQRLLAASLGLPALLALCYGMWRLARALGNVERSALFDVDTIGHLRVFAGATLASTLLGIVELPLRTLLLHFGFARPGVKLSIGVSSDQVLLILVCALFYLVIRIMHEGRRLAEENEGFV
jgi:hypothetical protein